MLLVRPLLHTKQPAPERSHTGCLHLHRLEHRRHADAPGRSSSLPGQPAGVPFHVDVQADAPVGVMVGLLLTVVHRLGPWQYAVSARRRSVETAPSPSRCGVRGV
jgi:hypothetical protein